MGADLPPPPHFFVETRRALKNVAWLGFSPSAEDFVCVRGFVRGLRTKARRQSGLVACATMIPGIRTLKLGTFTAISSLRSLVGNAEWGRVRIGWY